MLLCKKVLDVIIIFDTTADCSGSCSSARLRPPYHELVVHHPCTQDLLPVIPSVFNVSMGSVAGTELLSNPLYWIGFSFFFFPFFYITKAICLNPVGITAANKRLSWYNVFFPSIFFEG